MAGGERNPVCYRCGAPLDPESIRKFKSVCDNCDGWVHCCRNCALYDEAAHNNCKSPSAEWVGDAEKANYCAEFEFRRSGSGDECIEREADRARRAWDSLFKSD